jgi:hypothetical protein
MAFLGKFKFAVRKREAMEKLGIGSWQRLKWRKNM